MTQNEELTRVRSRIAPYIKNFMGEREGVVFTLDDLVHYIRSYQPNMVPDSASRIMRDLRARGEIRYALVSRPQGLYRAGAR